MSQAETTKRLARLDSCAISDALDKLGLEGFAPGLLQRAAERRIAGQVVTYKLARAADAPAQSGPPRHLGTTAVQLAQPGQIIVVEQTTGVNAGCWGGILTLSAKLKGIAGVVADGPVRDIDEARSYDFPVYSSATTARTARARVAEVSTNEPVVIAGVTVSPGDYVMADASGVVFIAQANIEQVLDAAEQIAGKEAAMAKALLDGKPVTEVMGADYEHMLR